MRPGLVTMLLWTIPFSMSNAADQWRWSVVGVTASTVADVTSSWGYGEGNPLLRNRRGEFGVKGLIIKSAIIGGYLGAQHLILRKRPQWRREFTVANWALAGFHTGVAIHNFKVRKKVTPWWYLVDYDPATKYWKVSRR